MWVLVIFSLLGYSKSNYIQEISYVYQHILKKTYKTEKNYWIGKINVKNLMYYTADSMYIFSSSQSISLS